MCETLEAKRRGQKKIERSVRLEGTRDVNSSGCSVSATHAN